MNEKDKVTIENSLKEINRESLLDDGGGNISLYLFENKNTKTNPITIYELTIDKDIINEMREFSKEHVSFVIASIPRNGIPDYNPDKHQDIFKIDSQEVPMFREIYQYISGQRGCAPYVKDDVKEDKLKAWILRFGITVDGRITQIYFFQRFQPAKMLGSKKKFSIFEKGGKFYLFKEDIFSLNQEMDFLLYKNTFVVTKMFSFEKIFGYEEFYKEKATKLVNTLAGKKIPALDYIDLDRASADEIETKINENTPLAHKFYSARTNKYYKRINFKKLVGLDKKYGFGLTLNLATKRWIIDDKSDLKVVARILNDDYERSQLTPNAYLALGKEKLPH